MSQTEEHRTGRQRAPAMNVELRRAAIVAYTIPLLVEQGPTVTTSQIAEAAGIAEGTVFRAFRDKRELLVECLRTAIESEGEANLVETIDPTLPLAERLTRAIDFANQYQQRVWAVAQAVRSAGVDMHELQRDHKHEDGPPAGLLRMFTAVTGVFAADADALRVEPELAARMLLGLAMASRLERAGFGSTIATPADDIVDLFLHGTLKTDAENEGGNHE